MAVIFGGSKAQAQQQPAISGLQIQTSAYGKVIPVVFGTTRVAPNLIWYGDFRAIPHQSSPAGGAGKGGAGGGGGKGGGSTTTYTYDTAVQMALCEGPIQGVGAVWANKTKTNTAALNMTVFTGTYPQNPWSYLESTHPDEALPYNGIAHIDSAPYDLGDQAQLPQHTFEVLGLATQGTVQYSTTGGNLSATALIGFLSVLAANGSNAAAVYLANLGIPATTISLSGTLDADPSLVVPAILSNPHFGIGFPDTRIGDLSQYQNYCLASNLLISPAYTDQSTGSQVLQDLAIVTNSEWVWNGNTLTLVPYGDLAVTGNGVTYNPPASPIYDLTDRDFIDPPQLTRPRPADAINTIQMEYLNRNNDYNPEPVEWKDQAAIDQFGVRINQVTFHMLCDPDAALQSVILQGQRQAVRNTYQFSVDARYCLLDVMDIVTLTDSRLKLNKQWVRITDIKEDGDDKFQMEAEEYLYGTGNAALFNLDPAQRYAANYEASPGNINRPVIFEPPDALAGDLEIWIAISGGTMYGGCDIYMSTDNENYRLMDRHLPQTRTGFTKAVLPAVTALSQGQTVDTTSALPIDLSESRGQFLSVTQASMYALNTTCYVDGEFIAYENAALTSTYHYTLSTLVRGAYTSTIKSHPVNSRICRVDNTLYRLPYTPDRIGQTVYFKFVAFNIWKGGIQSLADVPAYPYTIQGTAYTSPLPDVKNLVSSYVSDQLRLQWDPVADFRPVDYEVRKGSVWVGAQILGRSKTPLFPSYGDGTYLVKAHSSPKQGIDAWSADATVLTLAGAALTSNVIATFDEAATGWTGTLGGTGVIAAGVVSTSDTGNILTIADYLGTTNILAFGGGQGNATYEIPVAHQIDVGSVVPCQVLVTWTSNGQVIGSNILSQPDIIGMMDYLGMAASENTDVYPELALSMDGVSFGSWQRFAPGVYSARKYKIRFQLVTNDPQTQASLTGATFSIDVPDRVEDHNVAIPAAGQTITYPGGAFNGGILGNANPQPQVTVTGGAAGDTVVLSAQTKTGFTVQVFNAGAGVARNINYRAQGY